ncbi:MAG TPA: DM13 domain-containing protein [Cyclobacteriaceae bacterium]|nr:DM13 domain-containing protein [Cyclobacteriaceae bacterium]
MKNLIVIFSFLLLVSCSNDEDNTPTAPIDDDFEPTEATLLKEGEMVGVGHTVSGTAKVYDEAGKKTVVLDPFSAQNGPDLKVYLSKDENATEYINLGPLKSTMGKQSYDVTGMPDINDYKFVIIWCQQFSVLFGKAELK